MFTKLISTVVLVLKTRGVVGVEQRSTNEMSIPSYPPKNIEARERFIFIDKHLHAIRPRGRIILMFVTPKQSS